MSLLLIPVILATVVAIYAAHHLPPVYDVDAPGESYLKVWMQWAGIILVFLALVVPPFILWTRTLTEGEDMVLSLITGPVSAFTALYFWWRFVSHVGPLY